MLGSSRQYLEKALQTIAENPIQTEYCTVKKQEISNILEEITSALKNTNAKDAAKKAKSEEDDLDLLFQPKKKW
jgi:D-arabinose 1-dehydrogenase-like Zn-dependent alcohol dehydrogenase